MTLQTRQFASRAELETTLCDDVAKSLRQAIEARGQATLVVSGGRTPIELFRRLSEVPLPWSKVTITLADERWVTLDDEASNERMLRENLLINAAASANFIPLKNDAATALAGEAQANAAFADQGEFAIVLLGMGEDGHTASLFPGAEALPAGLDMASGRDCIAVTPVNAPHDRMSLTLPRLLNSAQIILQLCGDSKVKVLEQAMAGDDVSEMPVRAVLQQQLTPVSAYLSP